MDPGVRLHTKGRHVCGRNAEVDGDVFKYKGPAANLVGVVKIAEPMSPMFNYFEYEIIDKGQDTAIGIGLGEYKYPLDRMPGWNRSAIGYHADDGRLFHESGYGEAFGPLCTQGDRMGCGIHFDPDLDSGYVYVFFTKNGSQIKEPVKMKRPLYGFYPLVGLHSIGEKVRYLGHCRRVPNKIQEPMETELSPRTYWLRSNGIRYVDDGLTLEYDGDGLNRQDVGIAQALFPLSSMNHYFELEILDSGRNGWIAIGLGKSTYSLTKHPGWCEGSVGYHADNGHLYKEKGQGDPFGPLCSVGDIMGCGVRFNEGIITTTFSEIDSDREEEEEEPIDSNFMFEIGEDDDYYDEFDIDPSFIGGFEAAGFRRRILPRLNPGYKKQLSGAAKSGRDKGGGVPEKRTCTVYFTRNGELVGETECTIPNGGFYPLVAMLSEGERIRVNFCPLTG